MINKSSIYNSKQTRPGIQTSTKTITMGDREHVVFSPQEFQRHQRELVQLKRQMQQLQNEITSLRNQVRTLANKPAPTYQSPWGPGGGPGGY